MMNQMLPAPSATPAHGAQQGTRPGKLKSRLQRIAATPFSVGKRCAVGVYHSLCCCGVHPDVLADDTEGAPLLADAAAVVLSSPPSQVIIKDEVRLARKEWVKEQAAAHLARSTAAHTTTILQGWREIAAVQRCQRLAVKEMLQRRQQHNMAKVFVGWQLYVAARNDLRSIGARLAHQMRLNALKLCFGAWREECQQQQASRLQKMAARLLQRWKVAAEVKQGERVQAAAALAAMKRVKLAQAFAAWHQHCKRSQKLREVGAAIMAKRRSSLVGYSLLTMQAYAAEQANKKHQMHSAEQLHRLHVKLEAFAAWRVFMQVRRVRVEAFVAKRKAYSLGCSLITLQEHAHSKKQLMHKAHRFHRLNVLWEGFISLRLHLQEAKRKSADKAHLASHSHNAAAPFSAVPKFLPPLLARAPSLLELAKRGPPASVRHKPLFKSASSSYYTISAAAGSGEMRSLHRSVSDKQWSSVGPDVAQTAHNAAQLGSSSGLAAAWFQVVPKKPQVPLQPDGGNDGIMVTQQLSGVSVMLDKVVASREPSFSQDLGSTPPGRASSPSSGLKMEAGSGSLTAVNGFCQDTQQLRQEPSFGPHGAPSFLPQQDSGRAELYASMMGPMYEQHGAESDREGLAARLLRTASSASSITFSSSSSAGQRSPAGIKAQYVSAAKASMQKLSANMQTRAGAAAEAFADSAFADKIAQKQQAFLQHASTSDAAAVADRLAAKGQDVWRRAAASDAAAAASATATNAAAKAVKGAASMSAVAQQWTAKGFQWGNTISWFD